MIIQIAGNSYTVGLENGFNVTPQVDFEIFEGDYGFYSHDYGIAGDKYQSTFTVVADQQIIYDLHEAIKNVDSGDNIGILFYQHEDVFGPAVGYDSQSMLLYCDILDYNITDTANSNILNRMELTVIGWMGSPEGSPVPYRTVVDNTFPELFYSGGLTRSSSTDANTYTQDELQYTAVANGPITTTTGITKNKATYNFSGCDFETIKQLQYFYTHGYRGNAFAYTTNAIKLFSNSATNDIHILSLTLQQVNFNTWNGSITVAEA